MTNVFIVLPMSESLLCWLNSKYRSASVTNSVHARVGFWRTLLTDNDRRATMLHNKRAIGNNLYIKGLVASTAREK